MVLVIFNIIAATWTATGDGSRWLKQTSARFESSLFSTLSKLLLEDACRHYVSALLKFLGTRANKAPAACDQ